MNTGKLLAPILRIAVCTLVGGGVAASTACSKLGGASSPTAPSLPPASGSTIIYSAVGASDVIGYGSSRPCIPFEDCDGTGYVWVAARALRGRGYTVNVINRGWPGAVISRQIQDLGNQSGHEVFGNLTEQSAPFVDQNSTLVTVFAGVNDVNTIVAAAGTSLAGANPTAFVDAKADAFLSDYNAVLGIIRSRAPKAQIVVFNVPNVGMIPALASATLLQKQAAQRASVRMTSGINTTANVRVIDLMCDARFYQPSNISSDGLHPNDSGYALLGDAVTSAVTSQSYAAPRSACAQMTTF